MIILSGLTSAFISLYNKTTDPRDAEFHNQPNAQTFLQASAAAAQLGLDERSQKGLRPDYNKRESEKYLFRGRKIGIGKRIPSASPAEAISSISKGITLAWELRDKDQDWAEFPNSLPSAQKLSFRRLRAIFED
jgi:hypothetical protein